MNRKTWVGKPMNRGIIGGLGGGRVGHSSWTPILKCFLEVIISELEAVLTKDFGSVWGSMVKLLIT